MDKDEKNFISVLSAVAGAGTVGKVIAESAEKSQNMSDKHLALFLMR